MFAYCFALLQSLRADRKGVTALEYGLMAGLVSLAIVTAAGALGGDISGMFSHISAALKAAMGTGTGA